jgi:TonB dependent receptor-like, beta-barrel/Carboxypeptidase regulatory-like domain
LSEKPMGTPRRASNAFLAFETRFVLIPALFVCAAMAWTSDAAGQSAAPTRITQIATATTGSISGVVLDERGRPLDGVVVSALGTSSAFVVSDRLGQFTLRQLTPGPYLLRAHLQGYLPARNAMVNVRPSSRTVSSFTLHALAPTAPRIAEAGVGGGTELVAAPSDTPRDEGETAWRLRHLKRSILKDATSYVASTSSAPSHNWFITDSLYVVGRAVGSSAKAAGSLFGNLPLQGQVNLLTTGAFDNPFQLLQLERTRSVAYFAFGAPVALHGDWTVKAALNQGDLSSWLLTGNYARREPATHRYQFGMSYGVHRYEGGNLEAMAAVPEAARNVGVVYASDEWKIGKRVVLGYGGDYAHYDYLAQPAYVSPRISTTINATDSTRVRVMAARRVIAPGAEEFLPPAHAHVLPPQRTFAPLTRDGFVAEDLHHIEVGVEEFINGTTLGLRAFQQRVSNQLVTVFGMRTPDAPPAQLGHYFIASAGDSEIRGWTLSVSRQVAGYVRGSIDYSFAAADWTRNGRDVDYRRLSYRLPSAIRESPEHIHDITTSVETVVPRTATRVFFVVKMNSAYIRADASEDRPGLDGRFDMQLTQGLPFIGMFDSDWEMTIGVRNLFRDSLVEGSFYDELLVARPPKRLVGGITVRF